MFKSPALTVSRFMTTAIYLYMFICGPEVYGLSVLNLKGLETISTCSSGLRDGMDFHIFRGTVDATSGKVSNFVDFQIQSTPTNNFTDFCTVSISTCITPNPQPCYCAVQNGSIYEIVVNTSATISHSNANIRIRWKNSTVTNLTSEPLQVPTIYDVSAVNTSLTLNDAPMTCPATVPHGSVIKVQCLNSPSPCNISIAVNNTEVVKDEHSAIYTVSTNLTSNSSYNLAYSYSVCGVSVKSATCLLTIEEVTTTVQTSTTARNNGTTTMKTGTTVTVPTTYSTTAALVTKLPLCSLSCQDWAIALSVIYYVAILVIISTGIPLLVLSITTDKKTVVFYLCIGFLVFAEVLDIILIIVFAQAGPCECDPEPNIELALWEIMLIIFCIVDGLLIIASAVELILIFVLSNGKKKKQVTGSNSPEISPERTNNTSNTRKPKNDKNKNGQK